MTTERGHSFPWVEVGYQYDPDEKVWRPFKRECGLHAPTVGDAPQRPIHQTQSKTNKPVEDYLFND